MRPTAGGRRSNHHEGGDIFLTFGRGAVENKKSQVDTPEMTTPSSIVMLQFVFCEMLLEQASSSCRQLC